MPIQQLIFALDKRQQRENKRRSGSVLKKGVE
jgi:hypothetical protein